MNPGIIIVCILSIVILTIAIDKIRISRNNKKQ